MITLFSFEGARNPETHLRRKTARWSSGQDGGLSRRKREFDSPTGHQLNAPLAQLVEHLTLNQGVQGSSPWRCSLKNCFWRRKSSGDGSFYVSGQTPGARTVHIRQVLSDTDPSTAQQSRAIRTLPSPPPVQSPLCQHGSAGPQETWNPPD